MWVGVAFCLHYSIGLLADVRILIATFHVYKRFPFMEMARMARFVWRSAHSYYFWLPGVPIVPLCLYAGLRNISFPPSLWIAILMLWLHIVTYQLIPPTVLLLGSSNPDSFSFRDFLERGLFPYRVVVLFNRARACQSGFSRFDKNQFDWDNLRTARDNWRKTVHPLMGVVPVIVVDTRVWTHLVEEEVEWIVRHGLTAKTVLTTFPQDALPLSSRYEVMRQVPVWRLLHELRANGLVKAIHPDDNPLLKKYR